MASLSKASQEKRDSYYKNPDKYREIQRNYYQRHKERAMFQGARHRARLKNIPFDLTIEDIVIPECCPILGIPLIRNHNGGKPTKNSPSLDRFEPALGYTKENTNVVSYLANTMKSNATPEELVAFARWVLTVYPNE